MIVALFMRIRWLSKIKSARGEGRLNPERLNPTHKFQARTRWKMANSFDNLNSVGTKLTKSVRNSKKLFESRSGFSRISITFRNLNWQFFIAFDFKEVKLATSEWYTGISIVLRGSNVLALWVLSSEETAKNETNCRLCKDIELKRRTGTRMHWHTNVKDDSSTYQP